MKQIDIEGEMAKLAQNGNLYFLDISISYYEDYLNTTQNQLNHMIKECVKSEQIVKTLTDFQKLQISLEEWYKWKENHTKRNDSES